MLTKASIKKFYIKILDKKLDSEQVNILNRTQRRYTLINTNSNPETNTTQSEQASNENNNTNNKPGKGCIKNNILYFF